MSARWNAGSILLGDFLGFGLLIYERVIEY